MPESLEIKSFNRLMAYSAAAGVGAFATGQAAQATVVVNELQLTQSFINQATDIDWDGDGSFDHRINNGLNGVQLSPWCDQGANPACKGFDLGVTSRTYSSAPAAAAVAPFVGNSYYVTGFDAEQTIDATSSRVHFVDGALYTGFLTFLGFGADPDFYTHTAPGDFAGFSFENASGTHFGWVQVGLQTGPAGINSSTFLRYGYETDAGVGITTPLDGDFNFDGFVGIADLNIALSNWNRTDAAPGDWGQGDSVGRTILVGSAAGASGGDGFVGIADLNSILGNWNSGVSPAPGSVVPEPASLVLLAAGTGAMGLRRRKDV